MKLSKYLINKHNEEIEHLHNIAEKILIAPDKIRIPLEYLEENEI